MIHRILFVLCMSLLLSGQVNTQTRPAPAKAKKTLAAPKPQAIPVAPPKDDYNPDNLPPGEIACGRIGSKNAAPCHCMKARLKKADEAREKCMLIEDRQKRIECGLNADACQMSVVDAEGIQYDADGNMMPTECKRSCHKARCECCHT